MALTGYLKWSEAQSVFSIARQTWLLYPCFSSLQNGVACVASNLPLSRLSLRTFTKRAFLRTDSHSGFNLLQAAVLQGDYDIVYKASTYLENFVEEMKSETISNKASIFCGKSAVDILSALDCRKPGHADIEKLWQRLVAIDETLSELHSCAMSGDVEKVIELVFNDGIDVNVAAKSNITPLLLASPMSSGVLIKTLIDLGADVNAQTSPGKQGPLLFAASSNNYMVARLLLEHGADGNIKDQWGKTPLQKAVTQKNVPLVELFLENKADVNIQDWLGVTPLHKAVMLNDVPLVRLLLENKADASILDEVGETPLYVAVTQKNVPLVELLLENKADVNIQDWLGVTPLHKAVMLYDVPLVKLLLENKADPNIQDKVGETPLHIAVTQKDEPLEPLVKLLLEKKADANIQNQFGNTALHLCARFGFSYYSQVLIESGCNINVKKQDTSWAMRMEKAKVSRSAFHRASINGRYEEVNMHLKNGANVDERDQVLQEMCLSILFSVKFLHNSLYKYTI
ncbi:homeobox protein Wariai-like [Montipora capricornis]|uniref:homeobox protein Wariai-like n=1 Tax=Montipora capricornis TaxID=246305 RepID=UPI0035F12245